MNSAQRSPKMILAGLGALALALAGCAPTDQSASGDAPPGFFPPVSPTAQGDLVNEIYPVVLAIAIFVFVLVEGLLLLAILRRRRGETLPPQIHGSNRLELIWTIIPLITVLILFVMSSAALASIEAPGEGTGSTADESPAANAPARSGAPATGASSEPAASGVDPADTAQVIVDVTGFQWQWTFGYAREDLSFTGLGTDGPTMVVPTNERIRIRLEAADVIHSFYVPQFLFKRDVIPGRTNEIEFTIEEPGVYTGQCAEFCGLAHADMFFQIRAVPRAEYDAWVTEEQAKANATPAPAPSGGSPPPGGGGVIEVAAENSESFTTAELTAPADVPLTIQFDNRDPAAPHNVAIKGTPEGDWIGQPIANAGTMATYTAPALPPGQYEFFCAVHPNMTGTLTSE